MTLRTPAPKSSSFRVPSDVAFVSSARRRVVEIVRDWDVPLAEDTVETLELLAGEVIANAVVHTGEGCQVTVSWDGSRVRLDAEDAEGRLLPQRTPFELDEERGRGLQLVAALARRWGSRPTTAGKAVWFEIGSCPSTLSSSRPFPAACGSDLSFEGAQRPVAVAEPGCGGFSGSRSGTSWPPDRRP